jgi:hypothetical protein
VIARVTVNGQVVAANTVEARDVLGFSPWQQVTEAHAASWFRQVSRIRHQPDLNDQHYVCSRARRRVSLPITLTGVSSPHSTGSAASAVLIIPEPTARQYSRRLSRSVVPG